MLTISANPVLADSGRVYIQDGESFVIPINNTEGDRLWVHIDVMVLEGPPINVWVTDEEGYRAYLDRENASFVAYQNHSKRDSHSHEDHFYIFDNGTTYVIIDNDWNVAEGQGVSVQYTVTWNISRDFEIPFYLNLIMAATLLVLLAMVLYTVVKVIRERVKIADSEVSWVKTTEREADDPSGHIEGILNSINPEPLSDDDATGWDPEHQ